MHDIDISDEQMQSNNPIAAIGPTVGDYRQRIRDLLEKILQAERGITIAQQSMRFDHDDHVPLPFAERDPRSSDGRRYKLFYDPAGNWYVLAVRNRNGSIKRIDRGHLDEIPHTLEQRCVAKGIDFKQLARYAPDGVKQDFHRPTVKDFLKDYNDTDGRMTRGMY